MRQFLFFNKDHKLIIEWTIDGMRPEYVLVEREISSTDPVLNQADCIRECKNMLDTKGFEPMSQKEQAWAMTHMFELPWWHRDATEDKKLPDAIIHHVVPDAIIHHDVPEKIKVDLMLMQKLRKIEAKSDCGSVKLLDRIADTIVKFAKWQIKQSDKVRNLTTKIDAPCSISFRKAK
jgi:hypothetical protein